MGLQFEWDEKKAKINKRKHGITFEEATTAFADELSITIDDPLHSDDEDRLVLIGQSKAFKILIVIHVEKRESIRIISARKATKHEQKFYEEY
ncbi:MAG: BrnT family toxin [Epsilonproteobacteria bacterium]|nr:BrnT family toxin [Campylobacterota bacterium]